MGEVKQIPEMTDEYVWVCSCDCTTFQLHASRKLTCASCGKPVTAVATGFWRDMPDSRDYKEEAETHAIAKSDNPGPEFAVGKVNQAARRNEINLLACATSDGQLIVWKGARSQDEHKADFEALRQSAFERAVAK